MVLTEITRIIQEYMKNCMPVNFSGKMDLFLERYKLPKTLKEIDKGNGSVTCEEIKIVIKLYLFIYLFTISNSKTII